MSLVNDVLRDLDQRRRGAVGPERRIASAFASPGDRHRFRSFILVGIALLGILVGLASGLLLLDSKQQSTGGEMAQNSEAPAGTVARAVEQSAPETGNVAPVGNRLEEVRATSDAERFLVTLVGAGELDYQVTAMTSNAINLRLPGVEEMPMLPADTLSGLSIYAVPGGLNVNLEMEEATEFKLSSELVDGREQVLISGVYRSQPAPAMEPPATVTGQPEPQASEPTMPAAPPEAAVAQQENSATIKKSRELSFEEQDRNISQKGIQYAQRGQLMDAYRVLVQFIEANPQAHKSRETLATIMMAQQEYQQAYGILNQGLQLAPNYAPYKKLQARLLVMDGQADSALELLNTVPPELGNDPEYHDLLASLYQQTGKHETAIATYQNLLRHDPGQGRWWAAMAISLEATGSIQDAISSYQTALRNSDLDPNVRQYSQNRVRSLKQQL